MFWVRDKAFYRNLLALAIPIVFQNLLTFGVSLADNLMVGQLGEVPIAALHIGTKIFGVLQLLLFGLQSSLVILSAQYWGKRDTEHIKDVISISFRLSFLITAPFAIVSALCPHLLIGLVSTDEAILSCCGEYLRILSGSFLIFGMTSIFLSAMRSVEVVQIGLINSIVAIFVNVFLNYLLIFGHGGFPALAVRGAAFATFIARLVECSIVLLYIRFLDRKLRLRVHDFRRWSSDIFHDLVRYGTPLMGGQIIWAVNQFCQTIIIGEMGAAMLASISVVGTFEQFLCMGVFGLAEAVGITTGKTIGRREFDKMKTQAKTMQVVFFAIGLLLSTIIFFGNGLFLSFYRLSPETLAITRSLFWVLIVITAFRCYQAPCLMGLVKAGGDTSFVFKNDTIFVLFVVLPSAAIAVNVFHAAPWVVYACLLCDQVLKCLVAIIKINRFNWMRDLTRPKESVSP